MVMCLPFFYMPRWWCAHVLTEETQRHAEGGADGVMTPGGSHLRMEAETGATGLTRVRTARIAGNRNQEECVEQLSWSFLWLGSTNSSISDFWSPELEEYVSVALNHPSVVLRLQALGNYHN